MFLLFTFTVFLTCVTAVSVLDIRINGGITASIEDYPYHVSIRLDGYHYCGGSIIKANAVVTAAHCAGSRTSDYTVVAGTSSITGAGVSKSLSRINIHPDFDMAALENDVAVLILSSTYDFIDSIQPIALATSVPAPGSSVFVTGWGVASENGDSAEILQVVNMNIVSNEDCEKALQTDIDSSMLCGGIIGGGKDACQGDSGGPMMLDGQLVGIVSWGYGCARPDFPGVYTNIATLRSWIEANS